jgi:hypothetical protein
MKDTTVTANYYSLPDHGAMPVRDPQSWTKLSARLDLNAGNHPREDRQDLGTIVIPLLPKSGHPPMKPNRLQPRPFQKLTQSRESGHCQWYADALPRTLSLAQRFFSLAVTANRDGKMGVTHPGPIVYLMQTRTDQLHHSLGHSDRCWPASQRAGAHCIAEQQRQAKPLTSKRDHLDNIKASVIKQKSQAIGGVSVEVSRLLVQHPEHRRRQDDPPARAKQPVTFKERVGRPLQMLQYFTHQDRVEARVSQWDLIRRREYIDRHQSVRRIRMVHPNVIGHVRCKQRLVRLQSASDVEQSSGDVVRGDARQSVVEHPVRQPVPSVRIRMYKSGQVARRDRSSGYLPVHCNNLSRDWPSPDTGVCL